MLLSAAFVGLLTCFWPLRLLRYYAGFLGLYCGWTVLALYSSCSAQLIPNTRTGTRLAKWWFAVTLPASLIVLSLMGAAVTRAAGFRALENPSTSMEPTIQRGDHFIVDMRAFRAKEPQYQDVIVFYRDHTYFIKRLVAMSGDSIEGKNGGIVINGSLMNESYVEHSRAGSSVDWQALGTDPLQNFGPVEVPSGKYFVLGDNRDVSLDSRSRHVGFVDRNSVVGKVLYIYRSTREGTRVR